MGERQSCNYEKYRTIAFEKRIRAFASLNESCEQSIGAQRRSTGVRNARERDERASIPRRTRPRR